MQLRRMADASLALAERRPDDLKEAVERLGQAPPSSRQLLAAAVHGPGRRRPARPWYLKVRGILILILLLVIVAARRSASGSSSSSPCRSAALHARGSLLLGILVVAAILGRDGPARAPAPGEGARRARRAPAPGADRVRALHARRAGSVAPARALRRSASRVQVRPRYNVAPGDDVAGA